MPSQAFDRLSHEIIQSSLPHSRSCFLPYLRFAPKPSNPAPLLRPAQTARPLPALEVSISLNKRRLLPQPGFIIQRRRLDVHKMMGVEAERRRPMRGIIRPHPRPAFVRRVPLQHRSVEFGRMQMSELLATLRQDALAPALQRQKVPVP